MNTLPLLGFVPGTHFYVLLAGWVSAVVILWLLGKKRGAGMIAVVGAIMLGTIIIPDFCGANGAAKRGHRIANLKQIAGAKAAWADEHHKSLTEVPSDADLFGLSALMHAKPQCPSGGSYMLGAIGVEPTCSLANVGHLLTK